MKVKVMSESLQPHGLQPMRLLCLWDSPVKNTGVGCHSLLQRIFPTQRSNLGLPHCRRILNHLSLIICIFFFFQKMGSYCTDYLVSCYLKHFIISCIFYFLLSNFFTLSFYQLYFFFLLTILVLSVQHSDSVFLQIILH